VGFDWVRSTATDTFDFDPEALLALAFAAASLSFR
jgi:hypothetical protein